MTLGAHTADFDLVLEGTGRRITDKTNYLSTRYRF